MLPLNTWGSCWRKGGGGAQWVLASWLVAAHACVWDMQVLRDSHGGIGVEGKCSPCQSPSLIAGAVADAPLRAMCNVMHVQLYCTALLCAVVRYADGSCCDVVWLQFCAHLACARRRDLFTAVRLALAKLGVGGAGGEDSEAGGMPSYGTRVTINTGMCRNVLICVGGRGRHLCMVSVLLVSRSCLSHYCGWVAVSVWPASVPAVIRNVTCCPRACQLSPHSHNLCAVCVMCPTHPHPQHKQTTNTPTYTTPESGKRLTKLERKQRRGGGGGGRMTPEGGGA